jgi:hypothetical protein
MYSTLITTTTKNNNNITKISVVKLTNMFNNKLLFCLKNFVRELSSKLVCTHKELSF